MLYYIYYTIDTNFVWFEVGGGADFTQVIIFYKQQE